MFGVIWVTYLLSSAVRWHRRRHRGEHRGQGRIPSFHTLLRQKKRFHCSLMQEEVFPVSAVAWLYSLRSDVRCNVICDKLISISTVRYQSINISSFPENAEGKMTPRFLKERVGLRAQRNKWQWRRRVIVVLHDCVQLRRDDWNDLICPWKSQTKSDCSQRDTERYPL